MQTKVVFLETKNLSWTEKIAQASSNFTGRGQKVSVDHKNVRNNTLH